MAAGTENTSIQAMKLGARIRAKLPLLFLLLAFLSVASLFMVIGKKQEVLAQKQATALKTERPPVNVIVMTAREETIRDVLDLPGVIEAWTDLTLLAKIHGEIIQVPVREGDRVRQGQTIAMVDPADYRIALESARASLDLAEADLKRTRTLFEKKLVPRADLDSTETRVKTARAASEDAALQLSRCVITAPMDGVVQRLDAKTGLLLSVADPVARILAADRVKAVVGIPESDVEAVRRISRVELLVTALGNRRFTANKYFFSMAPANTARLYNLELEVANPDLSLLPGMFVRARIVRQSAAKALSVPLYSVIQRDGRMFVHVEETGVAHRRPVTLGILEKWRVQVTDGIMPGDRVIVEGHRNVEEGQRVHVARVLDGFPESMP